jgi:HSP20 family protein
MEMFMSRIHDLMREAHILPVSVREQEAGRVLADFQARMNRMFDHFLRGLEVKQTDWNGELSHNPALDIIETAKDFQVQVELAGTVPEDIEVETQGPRLIVQAARHRSKTDEELPGHYIRSELAYGFFRRAVTLPDTADGEHAEATFCNGILTVTVPKKAEAQGAPKKLAIRDAA